MSESSSESNLSASIMGAAVAHMCAVVGNADSMEPFQGVGIRMSDFAEREAGK
jgi:hypothetical protein